MKVTRIQLFVIVFILLLAPLIIYKSIWLAKSVVTKGVVLYTNHTLYTRPTQYYPVIQFTTDKYVVKVSGHYNAPYKDGDSVQLRYLPNHPTSYKIDTFWNCWIEVFIWTGFLLLFAVFFLARDIVPNKIFLINKHGIKIFGLNEIARK
jgi:hypothetical protein